MLRLLLLSLASTLGAVPSVAPKLSNFELQGAPGLGSLSPSGKGLLLEALKPCDWPWDLQAATVNATAVKAGDCLVATLKIRALKSALASGEVLSQFVFDKAEFPLRAGKKWARFQMPFKAAADYSPGQAQIAFRLGFTPQAMEIQNFELLNLGPDKHPAMQGATPQTYPGREKSAAWRKAALKRIAQIRTAPIRVKVSDSAGKPLVGVKVGVRQLKSAFRFGTAVSSKMLYVGEDSPDRARYKETLAKYFNMATEENSLKWKSVAGDLGKDWSLENGLRGARWIKELGLDFRGHCLVWPSWRNSPKLAEALKDNPEKLRKAVLDHVRATALAAKGLPIDWDVINEPWDNHDIMDVTGDTLITECFKAAHEADPAARLFINDYAIIEGGGGETLHRARYEEVIRNLISAGAPLDGIGIQGHFSQPLTAPEDMLQTLDRFAQFKKPLLITEYDVEGDNLHLSADFLRDLLLLCYSHPSVEGFLMWGFWDGKHWKKNAPLFKQDWSPKPAMKIWEELVMKEWKTEAAALSGREGSVEIRGHLGAYEVWAEKDGKREAVKASLEKGGLDLEIRLP